MRKLYSTIAVLFISFLAFSQDVPEKPLRDYPVNQFYQIFSKSEQNAIDQMVLLNYDSTGVQIVVVVVETTNGMPVNEYADWIGEKWGVGQSDFDNGIVFLIAVKDRKMAIETGYGVEQYINSVRAKEIIDLDVLPAFKKEEYYTGVTLGLNSIFASLQGNYQDSIDRRQNGGKPYFMVIFMLVIMLIIIFRKNKGGRGGGGGLMTGILLGSMGSSALRGGGGFGGGGMSSGGFGGFGGGSFGGGGASGGW